MTGGAPLLGCIADDMTGATDLANTLVRQGMRTVQMIGVPETPPPDADAGVVVVDLKSRTVPAAEAVALSNAALAWLRRAGAGHIFFKYCSTFDSTDAGNIGPVADALLANHGPIVASTSLDAAVHAVEELEETARLFLLLRGRKTRWLTPEHAAEIRRRYPIA